MLVILHPHWIHYKDLLFKSLAEQENLRVIFTNHRHSKSSLAVSPKIEGYDATILLPGTYQHGFTPLVAPKLWAELRRCNPALVVVCGWNQIVSWVAVLWAAAHSVPVVLWTESNSFDRRRYEPVELLKRWFLRFIDQAHVYGTTNQAYLVSLGFPARQIVTKGATFSTTLFVRDPTVPRPDVRTFLFVGRFSAEKNLRYLIEAVALLVARGRTEFRLRMVGYGPEEAAIRQLVTAKRLEDSVHIQSVVQQEELPRIYSGCSALILPSLSEAWGLVVNEAMACGLPVIVSSQCGCATDLVTEDTGWLVDPRDVASLVNAMLAVLDTSDSRLAEMGARCRQLTLDYSPEAVARRIGKAINELLGAKNSSLRCQ